MDIEARTVRPSVRSIINQWVVGTDDWVCESVCITEYFLFLFCFCFLIFSSHLILLFSFLFLLNFYPPIHQPACLSA